MTPSRYLVIQYGGAWAIRSGNRTFGLFFDHVHGSRDRLRRKRWQSRPPRRSARGQKNVATRWTYGRDPYPSTPGTPANGRATGTYRLP